MKRKRSEKLIDKKGEILFFFPCTRYNLKTNFEKEFFLKIPILIRSVVTISLDKKKKQ